MLLYSQDFDALPVGEIASGWTNITTTDGTADFKVSGSGSARGFGSTIARNADVCIYTDGDDVADSIVEMTHTLTGGENTMGLVFRSSADGASHYVIVSLISSHTAYFAVKLNGSAYSFPAQAPTPVFAVGDTIHTKVMAQGTTIRWKLWKDGTTEPDWQSNVTNASLASGTIGLYNGASSGTPPVADNILWNDFIEAPPEEPETVIIPVSDTDWFFSPGNTQKVGSTHAFLITEGAYCKALFSGTSATLGVDVSALVGLGVSAGNYPILRIKAGNLPAVDTQLTPSTTSVPLATGVAAGWHPFEVRLLSLYNALDRWGTPKVKITGLTLDDGAALSAPTIRRKRMLFCGDSIEAGLRVINASDTPSGNDAVQTIVPPLALFLNAEYAQVGNGGQGWLTAGTGNVPTFPNAYNLLYGGQARDLTGYDYMFVVHGTNDGGDVTATVTAWLVSARAAVGETCKIIVVVPFGGQQRVNITAGVTAYRAVHPDDTLVYLIDLGVSAQTGISSFGTPTNESADGLHPNAAKNVALAEMLINATGVALESAPDSSLDEIKALLLSLQSDVATLPSPPSVEEIAAGITFPTIPTPPSAANVADELLGRPAIVALTLDAKKAIVSDSGVVYKDSSNATVGTRSKTVSGSTITVGEVVLT